MMNPTDETSHATSGPPKRVLVVDDEESIRMLLKEYFEIIGLEVCTAPSGPAGLKEYEAGEFGLVLCDVAMPGMDGFDVFERIRKTNPDQKFLFMSGFASAESRKETLQISLGLLHKPFHLNDLNQILSQVFPDL